MKLPNNYGTIYKLSGNRRKPWIARKMVGKLPDPEGRRMKIQYVTIGYYEKKSDALTALARFNAEPYDPVKRARTLSEVHDAWADEYLPNLKSADPYKAAWKVLEPMGARQMADLTLDDYQFVIDQSEKNSPTLMNVKLLLSLMYKYAVVHEVVPPAKREMIPYIKIPKRNPNAIVRKVFTREEIAELWKDPHDPSKRLALILIFTGMRVGELLALKDEEVDFDAQRISITHAKTAAGVREVPIGDKILPLMKEFMSERRQKYSATKAKIVSLGHTPHDTRHTFASMAAEAGIDQRLIDAILGHAGANMALKIYTHFSLEAKLEAVNNLLEIC